MPIPLPPPTHQVHIKNELKGTHPRIFFDAAGLTALRAKAKLPELRPMLGDLLARADTIAQEVPPAGPPFAIDPRSLGDRLPTISLAYLMTGDQKYLEAARKWIKAIVGYRSFTDDYDLGAGHACFGMALAYDWLYNQLTPEERELLEKKMLRHGRMLLKTADPMHTLTGWPWGWSYFQNHFFINYTGISTVAMALYDVNPDEMQGWLDQTRSMLQVTHDHFATDGYYPEGVSYADYGTPWLLYYFDALRGFSGEDLFDMPYLKKAGEYFCTQIMPNWRDVANFADCAPQMFGRYSSAMLIKLARENRDGRLLTLLDRVEENKRLAYGRRKYSDPFCLIWADPSMKAQPLETLPLATIYADAGVAVFRTSWKEDAAVVAFRCGAPSGHHIATEWTMFPNAHPSSGHNHPDANSFIFWADGRWQIGLPGEYTAEKEAHNENTWLVGGKGQRGGGKWFEDGTSYMGRASQPRLIRAVNTKEASYIVGEAAPAYDDHSGLKKFERRLLFVKSPNPYIVVYDHLESETPQTFAAYFHAYESFMIPIGSSRNSTFQITTSTRPGVFLNSSGKFSAKNDVLSVVSHHSNAVEQKGFELTVAPEGTATSTDLITVVTTASPYVKFHRDFPSPEIEVGQDKIIWSASGRVMLNGKAIEGNSLGAGDSK